MNLAGSRKLLGLTIIALCGTLALVFGSFTESFATFLGAIYTGFIAGNVGEHMAKPKGRLPPLPTVIARTGAAIIRRPEPEPEPEPEEDPVEARLRAAGFDPTEVRAALTGGHR